MEWLCKVYFRLLRFARNDGYCEQTTQSLQRNSTVIAKKLHSHCEATTKQSLV